jgi:hypothetical protein
LTQSEHDDLGLPNYLSALIYINAKAQITTCLHCTERDNRALKMVRALVS